MTAEGLTRLLDYVVQGHRYNIIQYIGCRATTYISIPGLLIIHVPPLLLSVGTSVYAGTQFLHPSTKPTTYTSSGIALYHFVRVHRTLSNVLQASNSRLSPNLYVRLMAMSVTLMLWGTMLTSVMIWVNTLHGIQPWVSWKNVHLNWNRANVLIWAKADPRERRLQLLMWWWIPSSTAISFIFLGFGEDALREYRRIGSAVMSAISSRVLPNGNKKSGEEVPPVLSFPPSGLRSVHFTRLQLTPLTLPNVALTDCPLRFRQIRRRRTKRPRSCHRFDPSDLCIP